MNWSNCSAQYEEYIYFLSSNDQSLWRVKKGESQYEYIGDIWLENNDNEELFNEILAWKNCLVFIPKAIDVILFYFPDTGLIKSIKIPRKNNKKKDLGCVAFIHEDILYVIERKNQKRYYIDLNSFNVMEISYDTIQLETNRIVCHCDNRMIVSTLNDKKVFIAEIDGSGKLITRITGTRNKSFSTFYCEEQNTIWMDDIDKPIISVYDADMNLHREINIPMLNVKNCSGYFWDKGDAIAFYPVFGDVFFYIHKESFKVDTMEWKLKWPVKHFLFSNENILFFWVRDGQAVVHKICIDEIGENEINCDELLFHSERKWINYDSEQSRICYETSKLELIDFLSYVCR